MAQDRFLSTLCLLITLTPLLAMACEDNEAAPSGPQAGAAGESATVEAGAGGSTGGNGGASPSAGEAGAAPAAEGGASGGESSGAAGEHAAAAGAGGAPSASCDASASCFIEAEHLCDEWTNGCPDYIAETQGSCQNRGGVWAAPAACPTAMFEAKCALPANADGSQLTSRWYTGADTATQQGFCSGIGQGVWSDSF